MLQLHCLSSLRNNLFAVYGFPPKFLTFLFFTIIFIISSSYPNKSCYIEFLLTCRWTEWVSVRHTGHSCISCASNINRKEKRNKFNSLNKLTNTLVEKAEASTTPHNILPSDPSWYCPLFSFSVFQVNIFHSCFLDEILHVLLILSVRTATLIILYFTTLTILSRSLILLSFG